MPTYYEARVRVPFVDLRRLTARVAVDVAPAWSACLEAADFVGGPRVAELERRLSDRLAAPRVVACASGTDALLMALEAAGVRRGSKVALPNLTFWATFEAVARLGAVPVLVDVDLDDLQLDLEQLRGAHAEQRLDAVLLVHLYGWTSARLSEIRAFCTENGLPLVEDAAQAFGVEVKGRPLLEDAELATLSFYPTKVLGGAMDGGAVTLRSSEHEALVRALGDHGRTARYAHARVGWNSRMSALQAAYLSRVLDELDVILTARREVTAFYRERLSTDGRVRVWGPPSGVVENGYLSVVSVEGVDAEALVAGLAAAGIGAARVYPETIDAQLPARSSGAITHGDLRVSRAICRSVVSLPSFFGVRDDERELVARSLLAAI